MKYHLIIKRRKPVLQQHRWTWRRLQLLIHGQKSPCQVPKVSGECRSLEAEVTTRVVDFQEQMRLYGCACGYLSLIFIHYLRFSYEDTSKRNKLPMSVQEKHAKRNENLMPCELNSCVCSSGILTWLKWITVTKPRKHVTVFTTGTLQANPDSSLDSDSEQFWYYQGQALSWFNLLLTGDFVNSSQSHWLSGLLHTERSLMSEVRSRIIILCWFGIILSFKGISIFSFLLKKRRKEFQVLVNHKSSLSRICNVVFALMIYLLYINNMIFCSYILIKPGPILVHLFFHNISLFFGDPILFLIIKSVLWQEFLIW